MKTEYDTQAEQFMTSNAITFRATLSDTKKPAWDNYQPKKPCPDCIKRSGISKREYPLGHPQTVWEKQHGKNNPIYTHCPTCKRSGEVPDLEARTHGHHYKVTLSGKRNHCSRCFMSTDRSECSSCSIPTTESPRRLTFDFWSSIADANKGIKTVKPYDVLANISSDAYTPGTFKDFCSEYGYDADSIKANQTFRRCSAFAKKLKAFFTESELEQLQEIQ